MYIVDYKEIGKRIAQRRRALGLKQWQVTEMAELSDKYLSNIERAASVPSIDVLMKICSALSATPDEFLLGAGTDSEDPDKEITDKFRRMTSEQKKLALSLMDWILTVK